MIKGLTGLIVFKKKPNQQGNMIEFRGHDVEIRDCTFIGVEYPWYSPTRWAMEYLRWHDSRMPK